MKTPSRFFSVLAFFFLMVLVSCNEDDSLKTLADDAKSNDTEITDPTSDDDNGGSDGDTSHACESWGKKRCGMSAHQNRLMKNPAYRKAHQEKLQRALSWNSLIFRGGCNGSIRVPVAVHYQGASTTEAACLRQLAVNQIQVLNEDYQAKNADIDKWTNGAASQFAGAENGASCIQFVLANKNHPSGYGLSDGDLAVTINKTTEEFDENWANYINIYVQPNTGVLGHSPLGGAGNGDGVVVDAAAFGKGNGCGIVTPNAPYDLGRTLTHELGHYLLLDHIWGEGCGKDDGVADTPNQDADYSGCPDLGESSCGSKDMFMNYMDYVEDACMFMFSAGQVTRMENYLQGSLKNVLDNAPKVLDGNGGGTGGGDSPTCNDGVQNGDETGIDCGGSCAPCGNTATTDAGISAIVSPQGSISEPNIEAKIRLKNFGSERLTAVKIKYQFDDESTKTFNWTGSLEQGETEQVTLPTQTLKEGNHSFKVYTESPNNTSDDNPNNNQKTTGFVIACGDGHDGGGDDDNSAKVGFTIQIKTDEVGSETSWELKDGEGTVIAEGGGYQDDDTSVKSYEIELGEGCYIFEIYDEYGDGICCDYGDGWYKMIDEDGETVFDEDGQFGDYAAVEFCVDVSARKGRQSNSRKTPKRVNLAKKR